MPTFRIFITGVKRIDKRLKLLPMKLQKKIIRQAVRDGLKIVKAEMGMQVPVDTGLTKENIEIKAFKKRKTGRVGMNLQISGKAAGLVKHTKAGKRFFYPAVVEYGSKNHPPNPFGRRTFTGAGPAARDHAMQLILDGTLREALKP